MSFFIYREYCPLDGFDEEQNPSPSQKYKYDIKYSNTHFELYKMYCEKINKQYENTDIDKFCKMAFNKKDKSNPTKKRCKATNKNGLKCKRKTTNVFCHQHQ